MRVFLQNCTSLRPVIFVTFMTDVSLGTVLRVQSLVMSAFSSLTQGYRKLQAIAEQLIMFETLKQNFENSFISHITSIFELQVG